MLAEVITVGDELLLGQTVDTNSAWMGEILASRGIALNRITSISDQAEEIVAALNEARKRVDLILITGGLGPTRDDITKHTLADYFAMELRMNEDVLKRISAWFHGRGLPMLPMNKAQAMLPDGCTVLPNPRGTAMGMWFEASQDNRPQVIISMPGVPYEMKGLVEEEVLPRILSKWELPTRFHRTVLTQGIGESYLSKIVNEWEENLARQDVSIAYLPAPGQVRVRLSAVSMDSEEAQRRVNTELNEFLNLAGEHVVAETDISIAEALVELLTQRGETLSTAESCTGGAMAAAITSVAGSSAVFKGAAVAYANAVKIHALGVDAADIERDGAVSESVVTAMAEGARERMGTTYALAASGIAGPGGGTPDKPVGTIWIALATAEGTRARCLKLGRHRGRNVQRTVLECLAWVLRTARSQNKD
ncbi:MAG: competence/damage-inducible protein A [Crocinitomicaceae bacterium]|nr:competence/damage-inducible protein A [Crocinitomicaceae bacterium]